MAEIPEAVRDDILLRLKGAETEHKVRILLAVESGSRAWGFESPNSDFDCRFIYAHDRDWYVAVDLEEKRDVIEYPIVDDVDINGWDIRKALRLFWRSNPAFIEWIQSPIVYLENGQFSRRVRDLVPVIYSPVRGIHHYRSMAKTNYRGYLRGDQVPLKKYFYVLRPLLAVRWLERYECAAPIEFGKLLHLIEDRQFLLNDIEALLERKRASPELGLSEPVVTINTFIEEELERLEGIHPQVEHHGDGVAVLNDVFRECIEER